MVRIQWRPIETVRFIGMQLMSIMLNLESMMTQSLIGRIWC